MQNVIHIIVVAVWPMANWHMLFIFRLSFTTANWPCCGSCLIISTPGKAHCYYFLYIHVYV